MADDEAGQGSRPEASNRVRLLAENIRTAAVTLLIFAAVVFLVVNWGGLADMVHNLKSFEIAGAKVEFGDRNFSSYDSQVSSNSTYKTGLLTREQFEALEVRGRWAAQALRAANLLWVDPAPEFTNNERQFLESFQIKIWLSRDIKDAFQRIKTGDDKFDLVVSTLSFFKDDNIQDIPSDLKGPLANCPVHWFELPPSVVGGEERKLNKRLNKSEENALLQRWNALTNEGRHTGFLLAEHIHSDPELIRARKPPIIFYTVYSQPVMTICSETIASTAFVLYDSIFNHLVRNRWQMMEQSGQSWQKAASDKHKSNATGADEN